MNRLKLITSALVCLTVTLFTFTGCKKDDADPVDEKKAFIELTASEQEAEIKTGFAKYLGKKYKLLSMSIYTNDVDMTTEYPNECEQKVTITLPATINSGSYIIQDSKDNSCALSWDDALKLDLKQYGFSNYKVGLPFFTVMNNTVQGVLKYSENMFFYVDEDQGINVDDKYLDLFQPRSEDLEAADANYGKVAARFSKRYTFEKIN